MELVWCKGDRAGLLSTAQGEDVPLEKSRASTASPVADPRQNVAPFSAHVGRRLGSNTPQPKSHDHSKCSTALECSKSSADILKQLQNGQ